MAVNKNFVVKNGLEVNTNLIVADANSKKVGIGSTAPRFTLDVGGGIGATDFYLSGVGTFANELHVGTDGSVLTVLGVGGSVGIGTTLPEYLLDIRSPVSTGQTALYIQGDVQITGDLLVDDITFDDASVNNLTIIEALNVTSPGISTFNGYVDFNDYVDISAGLNVGSATTIDGYLVVNATSDFLNTVNISGLTTLGGYVDINNSVDISADLNVSGIATIASISVVGAALSTLTISGIATLGTVEINSGIVTAATGVVTYYGDGQYLDISQNPYTGIGIGTTGGLVGYGITFIDLKGTGVSTTFYDNNLGIATIFFEGGSGTIGIGTTFPTFPVPENGDLFYNAEYARLFVYYNENVIGVGTDSYWIDAAPFNMGTIDADNLNLNSLTVNTYSTLSGITTINGSLSIGATLSSPTGIITYSGDLQIDNDPTVYIGTGVTIYGNAGIVSAVSFYGDGSNLDNTGSILSAASGTQRVVTTNQTSGTMTSASTDADLTFNATTNTLSVPQVSVGSAVTATSSGLNVTGIVTATELQNTRLVSYSEKLYNYGNTGANPNINLSNGTYVLATLDQSATFTFTMPVGIQTGLFGFTLQLKNGAGSLSIVWPGNVYWPDTGISAVPARTVTNGKTDIWSFLTYDGGSTWLGSLSLLDYNV